MPEQKSSPQELCDELMNMGDILGCAAVNQRGKLLGVNYGQVAVGDDVKQDLSQLATVIIGAANRGVKMGGRLMMVSLVYENLKLLLIPIGDTKMSLLLAVEAKLDSSVLKDRVVDFMKYWLKANHYIN